MKPRTGSQTRRAEALPLKTGGTAGVARLLTAVALLGVLVPACGDSSPTGPDSITNITVTPDATLQAGHTQQFTAVATDIDGNVVSFVPEWSVVASGGSISDSGMFTAGGVLGVFTGTVQASNGSLSGTATVTVVAGPLATIEVTPDPATLEVDETQQFAAVGRDADGNVVAVTPTWSVVNGGGAIDAGSGLFTAGEATGTFDNTVEVTSGTISGTATVEVIEGPLATIEVTPSPAVLGMEQTQQFTAVGRDAGGNVVAITPSWAVVNGGGTIDGGSGLFTAGEVTGTFDNTVEVTSGTISGTATVEVVGGAPASIEVTPNPAVLGIDQTQQFTAVGRDADGNVVAITPAWSVVNGGGSIDTGTGLFTPEQVAGTFNNTVEVTSDGLTGTATVTVFEGPLASIEVRPNAASLQIDQTQQFTAVGRDAAGNAVAITPTWSVVNQGGSIDGSGLFTAGQLPGTFTHTVEATSGAISGAATVEVIEGPVASIEVTPNPGSLAINETRQFTAVGRDAGGNVVAMKPSWSVVNGGGTIDSGSGLFTAGEAVGSFTNTVVATSDGITGAATADVIEGSLASIEVTPNPGSLAINETQQFAAVGRDAGGNVVAITPTWSVVNGGGTIDASSGLFTAGEVVGSFTNTVVATSDGITGSATADVTEGPLASIEVTPDWPFLFTGQTQQFTAVGRDAGGNVVEITTTWAVVNGGGTIDSGSGLFTAGEEGIFIRTVEATSDGITGSASVDVF